MITPDILDDNSPKVLIIDDDITIRKLIAHHLLLNNYKVIEAKDADEGFSSLHDHNIDLVLCDVSLGKMDGFTFCQKVRENKNYTYVPFMFVTAKNTLQDKTKALDVGGDDFITKPFDVQELLIKVKSLIRRFEIHKLYGRQEVFAKPSTVSQARIALVDDDSTIAQIFQYNLNKAGFDCRIASNAAEGFKLIKSFMPDLIISDIMMPKIDGLQFRRMILDDPTVSSIPFIFFTAKGNEQDILNGYDLEITDYIVKSAGPKVVIAKVTAILNSLNKVQTRVISELHKAADSLRAKVAPTAKPVFENFIIEHWHQPFAGIPGGDFIDYISLGDNNLAIILGDVMGKKWGAWYFAFAYAGYIRSAVRSVFEDGDLTSPALILKKVNNAVYQDSKVSEVFTTLSVIILDKKNMVLKYSGAGDLPIIFKKANSITASKIRSDGLLLGFLHDSDFIDSNINMEEGDFVVLMSDGVVEATNENREQYGTTRLINFINSMNGSDSVLERIKENISGFSKGRFEDDISLITIEAAH